MMILRSVLFVVLFNLSTLIQLLFWTPVFFFLKPEDGWKVPRSWAWNSLWLQHFLIGTRYEFRGVENIPTDGSGMLVASKHQSAWETYTMLLFVSHPSYILKRELMFVPFFGWFAQKMRVIAVNRGKRSEALKAMNETASQQLADGRQIIIYPEGTRRNAYAEPSYKYGVSYMYQNTGARVLPVALNSGLFWPRNGFLLHKGTCVLEFLPIIEPGLSVDEFSKKMETVIEAKSNALMAEAEADPEFDGKGRFLPA